MSCTLRGYVRLNSIKTYSFFFQTVDNTNSFFTTKNVCLGVVIPHTTAMISITILTGVTSIPMKTKNKKLIKPTFLKLKQRQVPYRYK